MDIALNAEVAADLLRRVVPARTPLDAWPTEPLTGITLDTADVVRQVAKNLLEGVGFAVVRWPTDTLDDQALCSIGWNLFTLLCAPVPQYSSGELIYPVEMDENAAEVSHYSGSSRSGGHHTDGTLLLEPPTVACLFGLSAADGGETIIMDGLRLYDLLAREDPAYLAALSRPVHFDVQGQVAGLATKQQPIFYRNSDEFELRYLRRYIESGYAVAGCGLPDDLRAAMDRLDEFSADERNQTPVLLHRGAALIWDNRRMLHGRRAFIETTSKRRLRRIYGHLALNRAAAICF